jgi:hypothetical protein
MGIGIKIVGIEDSDHLTGCEGNAFIHRIINTLIRAAYPFRNPGVILSYHVKGPIG